MSLSKLPKAHISPTQINMYLRCPAQYRYRYVEGIVIPPTAAMTKGRAVHKGQEHNYLQKIESFTDLKLSEVQEVTAAEFEALADSTEWHDEKPSQLKDESIQLASLYHTQIAPTVQPIMVEERVEVPLDPDVKLVTILDVVDIKGMIRDTKTAAKSPTEDEVTKSLQLTAYALAYRHAMGSPELGVALDYLVQTKVPKAVSLQTTRTQQDIQRFLNITAHVTHAIRSEIYYPNPNNFMCSERSCGYWSLCQKDY